MKHFIVKKKITRLNTLNEEVLFEDYLLSEKSLSFMINDSDPIEIVMTSGDEELWALGNLFTKNIINCTNDIISMDITESSITVKTSCHILQPTPPLLPIPMLWTVSPGVIQEGMKWISDAPLYKKTGSTHVAALLSFDGKKLFLAEDIKRHNAVDKAVGWLLKKKYNPANTILITSGRLPKDMVLKGVSLGIPLIASVSASTEQGVVVAKAANMTLIGFVREGRMNIYTHAKRISFYKASCATN